jgi:LuxR family transcriptional regulator, maltose regulon positive regulatory protein
METFLVATKLRIPVQPRQVVHRGHLVDSLEENVPRHKLTLVAAPAGYGKTTLLVQWAGSSRLPVAWVSIGEEDDDVARFFRYLLTAWEEATPGVMESPLGMLLGGMMPDMGSVLPAFVNEAGRQLEHMVFVLDDYHLIRDDAIHQALTFLLDHLPPTIHFVLAGREEPPIPLARYRARHELLELRAEEILFSLDETADFLNRLMKLGLSQDEVVALQNRLEGWIAGLQLVALSLPRHREAADRLFVSGRHRFIADYLSEDVLAHLPEELRRFLLQTSILDRLSGPLCDAVTGRNDGQEMLETLERRNLFLVPLDDSREWFRYHQLFTDFLRGELNRRHSDEVAGLHSRAAMWYLAHDLPDQALRHAVSADDAELVMQIGERYFVVTLHSGEFTVLKRWLESLPERWHSDYPMIGLIDAGVLAFTGDLDACVRCVDGVEQRLSVAESKDKGWHLARVTAVRCSIACFQNDVARAESYADSALRELPEEDYTFRADIHHALGDTYRRNGRWEEARQSYLRILDLPPDPSFHIRLVHVFGALADLELRRGRLHDSAAYWRKALALIQKRETWGSLPLPLIGWVHIRMGEILYEWNELEEAWDYLSRGLERVELGGDVRAMIAGHLITGRLKLTQGDIDTADQYLEQARPLLEEASFPDWTGRFERLRLELWLAQNRLRAAVNWVDEMLRADAPQGRPDGEATGLAVARVLIVKGDTPSVERAQELLQRLLSSAEAEGRVGIAIEAQALQALAHGRRGEVASAMTSLERALRLAESEGYVRLFADLGLPMARLLQEARSRDVMPHYVERLLSACGAGLALFSSAERALPEPLTHREQETLGLLAAGLTNREIADRLVISPETVKKHTGTIYGKLGVRTRTEAAARARELNLLG